MTQSTDPAVVAATERMLDDTRVRLAIQVIARYDGMKPSKLSGKDLRALVEALDSAIMPAWREQNRRKETPRGKGRLRLIAENGVLNFAGQHHVRALKAAKTRRARSVAR